MTGNRSRRRLLAGVAFLLPNLAGFCAFTLVPLAISVAMAFSDWDFLRHNLFRSDPLHWVGLANFSRLASDPQFWRDLGNTGFLMLGLPFAIAGSLAAALLLDKAGRRRAAIRPALAAATLIFVASASVLLAGGMAGRGVLFLFGLLAAAVLLGGVFTQGSAYRTLFYLPHFTAGVATFVLWQKLYDPTQGPINAGLQPLLDGFAGAVRTAPAAFALGLPAAAGVLALALAAWQWLRLRRRWDDAEAGASGIACGVLGPSLAFAFLLAWRGMAASLAAAAGAAAGAVAVAAILRRPRPWGPKSPPGAGLSAEAGLALLLVPGFLLLAAAAAFGPALPAHARAGIEAPDWLGSYSWAKPSLMIMALWAAIGSNNMILYLAGLTAIPPELYEAADLDGASPAQRFWNVTWPELGPVTVFVAIMGIIEGLQGGFEMARTMTAGGPAGSTTTLSYQIYTEGFTMGRVGYASAVAWVLFVLVFTLSLLSFRHGNRRAED